MSDDERRTEGNDVDEQDKKLVPRSDTEAAGDSEVEEHGYRFPGEDGRVRHPETSDSEVSER